MPDSKSLVSPYIARTKDRKIRLVVGGYLEAYRMFKEYNKSFHSGVIMSFSNLRKVQDILWDIKENLHVVYKRILNPKKRIFEQANKFTPSEAEIKFINNVGLLFHKVMVARELKYILDYYQEDSDSYQETKASLDRNLDRIDDLFNQGLHILVSILENYQQNIQLITYFLENKEQCQALFNQDIQGILKMLARGRNIEDIYIDAVHYYQNSGWSDRAEQILKELLQINPKHEKAALMLQAFNL
jgi:hypothetical protein